MGQRGISECGEQYGWDRVSKVVKASSSWKLETGSHVMGQTIYPSVKSGGGKAHHLTGALLIN